MDRSCLFASIPTLLALLTIGCGKNSGTIHTLADAEQAKLGVMTGTTGEVIAKTRFPRAQIKSFDDVMDAVGALKVGQLDGIVTAYSTAIQISKRNPELGALPEPLSNEGTSVAFRKADRELLAKVNVVISELKSDGTLASMKRRWFKTDLGPYEEPELVLPREGIPLRVGVSATREPFSFVDKDGRVTGHDGELARIIASRLHRPIEFSNMKFMALIPALQSGKIDMIVTGMSATKEREQFVDFSQSYFESPQVMFVRRSSDAAADSSRGSVFSSFLRSVANSFRSNLIEDKRYLLILDGLKTTVILSVFSALFGTLLGACVCSLRMSKVRLLSRFAKIYISVIRGTPVLVLLMLIFYVIFASIDIHPILIAVLAFGMNFAAYASEIYRTGIEGVDKGQTEAGIAMGFSRMQTFLHIVLPQAWRRILPVYKGEIISMVKMTSIVGYIAVQDLTKASDIVRSRTFDAFFPLVMVAALYFAISWALIQSLGYVERVTDPKFKRAKVELA